MKSYFLFKIEREDEHLAPNLAHACGVWHGLCIKHRLLMLGAQGVGKSYHEFQFRSELEER